MLNKDILGLIRGDVKREKRPKKNLDNLLIGEDELFEEELVNKRKKASKLDEPIDELDVPIGAQSHEEKKGKPSLEMMNFGDLNKKHAKEQIRELKREYISLFEKLEDVSEELAKEESEKYGIQIKFEYLKKEMKEMKRVFREILDYFPDAYELKVTLDTTDWQVKQIEDEFFEKLGNMKENLKSSTQQVENEKERFDEQKKMLIQEVEDTRELVVRAEKEKFELKNTLLQMEKKNKLLEEEKNRIEATLADMKKTAHSVAATEAATKAVTETAEEIPTEATPTETVKEVVIEQKVAADDSEKTEDVSELIEMDIDIPEIEEFDVEIPEVEGIEDVEDIQAEEIEDVEVVQQEKAPEVAEVRVEKDRVNPKPEKTEKAPVEKQVVPVRKPENPKPAEVKKEAPVAMKFEKAEAEDEMPKFEMPKFKDLSEIEKISVKKEEIPNYMLISVDRYMEGLSDLNKYMLRVIGETGIERNSELIKYIEEDEEGRKYLFANGKLAKNEFNNSIKNLRDKQFLEAHSVKLGSKGGYDFNVYQLTDIGKSAYYKLFAEAPVQSAMEKVLANHASLEHGYLIIGIAEEFRAMGYKVYEEREDCTYDVGGGNRKVFDLIVEDDQNYKMHIEVERGTHNNQDFSNMMDKIYAVTQDIYFVAPNDKILYKEVKGKVFSWITSKLGGFENAKGKVKFNFSTYEKIKKHQTKIWEKYEP